MSKMTDKDIIYCCDCDYEFYIAQGNTLITADGYRLSGRVCKFWTIELPSDYSDIKVYCDSGRSRGWLDDF